MKRRKLTNRPLCLGDLILAVSAYSDSQEETAATVADLLASGQVTLMNNGRQVRAREETEPLTSLRLILAISGRETGKYSRRDR